MKGMALGIKSSDDMPIKAAKNLQIENMAVTSTANETTPYQSILEYLQQQNQPATAREIAKAVRDAIQAIP
jgi:Fe2+ or Zn2+ uptake regulation protein